MRATFCGVGEAFDETLPNTSLLVETGKTSLLMDCGFTAAVAFWKAARDPMALDGMTISHFHGDHYFGLPHLLVRFHAEGRTKPLTVFGGEGLAQRIAALVDLAYPNLLGKLPFSLQFEECRPGAEKTIGDLNLGFADNDHPEPCMAARVDGEGASVFYSGDGRATPASQALASGCDLIVHEAFCLDETRPGHGTARDAARFAAEAGAKRLALVHVARSERRNVRLATTAMSGKTDSLLVFLPEPGEILEL